jgi:hypothetical protein
LSEINSELRTKILQRVRNEYTFSKEELELILSQSELNDEKINLLVSLVKSCSWYQLRAILSPKELADVLKEQVINRLWPASLKSRYQYAAALLLP